LVGESIVMTIGILAQQSIVRWLLLPFPDFRDVDFGSTVYLRTRNSNY